jgi:hypothetical protein
MEGFGYTKMGKDLGAFGACLKVVAKPEPVTRDSRNGR